MKSSIQHLLALALLANSALIADMQTLSEDEVVPLISDDSDKDTNAAGDNENETTDAEVANAMDLLDGSLNFDSPEGLEAFFKQFEAQFAKMQEDLPEEERQKLEERNKKTEELQNAIDVLQKELDELEAEKAAKKTAIKTLKDERAELAATLEDGAANERLSELDTEIDEKRADKQLTKDAIATKQVEVTDATNAFNDYQAEVEKDIFGADGDFDFNSLFGGEAGEDFDFNKLLGDLKGGDLDEEVSDESDESDATATVSDDAESTDDLFDDSDTTQKEVDAMQE